MGSVFNYKSGLKVRLRRDFSRHKTLQKAAKDETLKPQSTPVFDNSQMGVDFCSSIWGFFANLGVLLKTKPPEIP
jgi:hypothetical protein